MDAIFRMMVVPNCANCEFKDRQKAEMIVDFNREKKEMKDEFNRNLDGFTPLHISNADLYTFQ